MDWNQLGIAFGALGGRVVVFATFAAVIVALWQTKQLASEELLSSNQRKTDGVKIWQVHLLEET